MSSSGNLAINSGPLIIRTVLDSSINNSYVLGLYDNPISSNRILTTSTNGLLVPTNSVSVSTLSPCFITANGSNGAVGQVLTSGGSNCIVWSTLNNFWNLNGSSIYNNNPGNVGVNNSNPEFQFQVSIGGPVEQDGLHGIASNSGNVNTIIGAITNSTIFGNANAGCIQTGVFPGGTFQEPYKLAINPLGGDVYIGSTTTRDNIGNITGTTGYILTSTLVVPNGVVGIGTGAPQVDLQVNGVFSTMTIIDNTGSVGTAGQILTAGGSGGGVVWGADGSSWVGTATSDLNMSNFKITNLLVGNSISDAPNISQVQNVVQIQPCDGNGFILDILTPYNASSNLPAQSITYPPYPISGIIFDGTPSMQTNNLYPPSIYNISFRCLTTDANIGSNSWPSFDPIVVRCVLFNGSPGNGTINTILDDKTCSGLIFTDSNGRKYFTFQVTLVATIGTPWSFGGNGDKMCLSFAWASPSFVAGNYYFNGSAIQSFENNFTTTVSPLMNNGIGY